MAIIKQLPVVLPPIGLQRDYVSQVEGVAASIDSMGAHSIGVDRLVASLKQRAFADSSDMILTLGQPEGSA